MADQINVNAGGGRRESGTAGLLAAMLIVALLAFLVWAFAFGGFDLLAGRPSGVPATSGATVDVRPNVNVNVPSGGAVPAKP